VQRVIFNRGESGERVRGRRARGSSHRPADAVDRPADAVAEGPFTLVAIDDELGRLRSRLQEALGPSYRVVADLSVSDAAAAVVPARVSRVEALRADHPRRFIVVYDAGGNEPGPYLEARADDYVAAASMAELAARIRAGLRRLSWAADGSVSSHSP
jgi:hypothetical protein